MDTISPERRSANMGRIRHKNTNPEVELRRLIHANGYRFRLHRRDLPGTPDIVFPSRKKVILVHGCFWHQHSSCREGRLPGVHRRYWVAKLKRNKIRDESNRALLKQKGWGVLEVWECELKDAAAVVKAVKRFLDGIAPLTRRRG